MDSEEDDSELRDLVTQMLKDSGTLGKIKAQLRSQVYLTLEAEERGKEDDEKKVNPRLHRFLRTSDGRLILQLVAEFLAFFDLKFALSVFRPEAAEADQVNFKTREQLIESLGLSETMAHGPTSEGPVLAEILRLSKVSVLKSESPTPTNLTEDEFSVPSSLESATPTQTTTQKSSSAKHEKSAGAAAAITGIGQDSSSLPQSNASTPLSSLTALGGGAGAPPTSSVPIPTASTVQQGLNLDALAALSKDKDLSGPKADRGAESVFSKGGSSIGGGSLFSQSTDDPLLSKSKDDSLFGTRSLGDLPKLPASSASSLGNLPPLNAPPRKTLAPLKKAPLKDKEEETAKPPDEKAAASLASAINSLTSHSASLFGNAAEKDEEEISAAASVEEELDFLSSSGKSGLEETQDETVSEVTSLRADYVEKI